jgi:hypothetical protein
MIKQPIDNGIVCVQFVYIYILKVSEIKSANFAKNLGYLLIKLNLLWKTILFQTQ